MKNSYLTVTDQFEEIPKQDPNEPSEAWVQGWDAGIREEYNVCMRNEKPEVNPYPEGTNDHREWLDGYECVCGD